MEKKTSSSKSKFKVNVKAAKKAAADSKEKEIKNLERQEAREKKRAKSQDARDKFNNRGKGGKPKFEKFERKIIRSKGVFSGEVKSKFSRSSGSGGGSMGGFLSEKPMFIKEEADNFSHFNDRKSGGNGGRSGPGGRGGDGDDAPYYGDGSRDLIMDRLGDTDVYDEDVDDIYKQIIGQDDDDFIEYSEREKQQKLLEDNQTGPIELTESMIKTSRGRGRMTKQALLNDQNASSIINQQEKIHTFINKWNRDNDLVLFQMPYKLPANILNIDSENQLSSTENATCDTYPYGKFGNIKIYKNKITGEEIGLFELECNAEDQVDQDQVNGQNGGQNGAAENENKSQKSQKATKQPEVKFNVNLSTDSAVCQEVFVMQNYDAENNLLVKNVNLKNYREDKLRRELVLLGNCMSKMVLSPVVE